MSVLIAVVDRIPSVSSCDLSLASAKINEGSSKSRSGIPSLQKVPNGGCEGMSVAYLDCIQAAPDLWEETPAASMVMESTTIEQRSSLSFAIGGEHGSDALHKIKLPVANTLFLNGKVATLLAQKWGQDPIPESAPFKLVHQRDIPEQSIKLMSMREPRRPVGERSLWTFLRPVTEPRTVATSAGNIVQRIILGRDGEGAPASQELESAIHERIEKGELPSQQTDVWALVRPKDIAYLSSTDVHEAIIQGCQLRKVLSGGGGWGVKQGLLSLDPNVDYGSHRSDIQGTAMMDSDLDSNRESSVEEGMNHSNGIFENIINPGDTVTFFVNQIPKDVPFEPDDSEIDLNKYSHDLPYNLIKFGTIPSTIDALPDTSKALPGVRTPKAICVHNYFGMLSEQGMSVQVSSCPSLNFDCIRFSL